MTFKFIDISNHQAGINVMEVVKNGGLSAVIVKATEGTTFKDKTTAGFVATLKANGVPFGFYHFARNNSPKAEAEFFRNCTKELEGYGIPVLDWEDGQSVAWVNEFVEHYHSLTGVWCWIYANPWRFNQGGVNKNCARWIAGYPANNITSVDYGVNNANPYKTDGGAIAWQFTSSAVVPGFGGRLDANVFYGDATVWGKYANPKGVNFVNQDEAPTGSVLELVCGVMAGKYGTGSARVNALGSRYNEVQSFINHIATAKPETLASETMAGKYGNGETRKIALGGRYVDVMKIINGTAKKSIDVIAREVIRGEWGNGETRRHKLEVAGYSYKDVQRKVNELL